MSTEFEHKIRDEYFNWLYDYVCKGRAHDKISYKKLFNCLYQMEFTFSIRNDVNRARDGINLRYRFAAIKNDDYIIDILDDYGRPCSVLEMMIALAIRCEETIMDNANYGDRTSQWFWNMMTNLGIGLMHDDIFDPDIVIERIFIFLDRQYAPDGDGGLFYINGCQEDLRDVEIWTQLCWYLDNFS